MFELKIAFRYLIPRKKKLSRSLISLVSFSVVSLVVWLTLVFLSVTEGLESKWLDNLVSLHAPARLTPNDQYYRSYDCLIDRFSAESDYQTISLDDKRAQHSLPYDPTVDPELPSNFPPEKQIAYPTYQELQSIGKSLGFYPETYMFGFGQTEIPLTTVYQTGKIVKNTSIVHSFSTHNPFFKNILNTPQPEAIKKLLCENGKVPFADLQRILENITIQPSKLFNERCLISPHRLDLSQPVRVFYYPSEQLRSLFISEDPLPGAQQAQLHEKDGLFFLRQKNKDITLDPSFSITLSNPDNIERSATSQFHYETKEALFDCIINFRSQPSIKARLPLAFLDYSIIEARQTFSSKPKYEPLWPYFISDGNKETAHLPSPSSQGQGILVSSTLIDQGVSLGDKGTLSYQSATGGAQNTLKNSFYIAGFYDSGIGGLGNKLIYAPKDFVKNLVGNQNLLENEGIFLWTSAIKKAPLIKEHIVSALNKQQLLDYWNVETYQNYDFSKDFVEQLQSDRLLLTLIAGIILIVAGSNIISMLLLLIHDKKSEIGILRALGTKPTSIALTFGFCGLFIGTLSVLFGSLAAYLTMTNLDSIAHLISTLQGHDMFNPAFYGKALPNILSWHVTFKIWIMTLIISFVAGLIPAIKACLLSPTQILRSDAS